MIKMLMLIISSLLLFDFFEPLFLCHSRVERNYVRGTKLSTVTDKSASVTSLTSLAETKGNLNRMPGIGSSSVNAGETNVNPPQDYLKKKDVETQLKMTPTSRPRKMPIISHQWQVSTASGASDAASAPVVPSSNVKGRSSHHNSRQLQQPHRKTLLNTSPRRSCDSSSRLDHSHLRAEVLMRSHSYRGTAPGESVDVVHRPLPVPVVGPVPPKTEDPRCTLSQPASAIGLLAPEQTRLNLIVEGKSLPPELGEDVAPITINNALLDCQFLQFESDGEEDW